MNFEALSQDWQQLEKNSFISYFLSWQWISVWITTYQLSPNIYRFYDNEQLVGMCCCIPHKKVKRSILGWRSSYLNRTGDNELDQIWIEYNDILSAKGYEEANRKAFISHFLQNEPDQELVVGPILEKDLVSFNHQTFHTELYWQQNSYAFSLKPEFSAFNVLLQQWSKNTRSQIKRSITLYQVLGELAITKSHTKEESLLWLAECATFHQSRWPDSGFNNPHFVDFHKNLLSSSDNVDLLKVTANDITIAYLYILKFGSTAYFYLSAINYEHAQFDNRLKPGLVSHALAIQLYASQGYKLYDFMGGESRYKKSLANIQSRLIVVGLQKKSLVIMCKNILQKLKLSYEQVKKYVTGSTKRVRKKILAKL